MHALVTGGGGFLGRYIVELLLSRGDRVRVLTRGEYPDLAAQGVEVVRGDVRNADAVADACAGIDCVFHTAAVPGIWGPWELFHETNTRGTQHVIAGCRSHGVPRLVYTSSPSVVFDGRDHDGGDESLPYATRWLCHYPHTKALAEQAVLDADGSRLSTVALRPHLIWGPRDNHLVPRLIRRARQGRLRRVGDGKNRVSTSYVENAAAAHVQAADVLGPGSVVSGKAYFINEPEPVNLWGWIDKLLALAGLPPVRRAVSARTASRLGFLCEKVYDWMNLPGEPPMTRFLAAQLAGTHCYSIERARRDFGYRPVVTVEEGMRRLGSELRRTVH